MGAITSTLNLTGNMAKGLADIAQKAIALDKTLRRLGSSGAQSVATLQGSINGLNNGALQSMSSSIGTASANMNNLVGSANRLGTAQAVVTRGANRATSAQQRHNSALARGSTYMGALARHIYAMTALYVGWYQAAKLVELSDNITGMNARMSFVIDDSRVQQAKEELLKEGFQVPVGVTLDEAANKKAVEALNNEVMSLANRTRASYIDTAMLINKLAMNTGDTFKSNDELLRFTETLNKRLIIAGASGHELRSILTQLPQALGSNNMQGDELRAIRENAPKLAQDIEDYARKVYNTELSLKEMGAQGMLSAELVKNAILSISGEVDEQFEKMPYTWSQRWERMKNDAIRYMRPVTDYIRQLANMEGLRETLSTIGFVIAKIAMGFSVMAGAVIEGMVQLEKLGLLEEVLYGAIGAFLALIAIGVNFIAIQFIEAAAITAVVLAKAKEVALDKLLVGIGALRNSVLSMGITATSMYATAQNALTMANYRNLTSQYGLIAGTQMYINQKLEAIALSIREVAVSWMEIVVNAVKAGWKAILATWETILNTLKAISIVNILKSVGARLLEIAVTAVLAVKMIVLSIAQGTATVAQWALNVATYFFPVTWLLLGIGAIIGVLFALAETMGGVGKVFVMVSRGIGRTVAWLSAFVVNMFVTMYNLVADIANAFGNIFNDPLGAIMDAFKGMVTYCLSMLETLASAVDSVLGTDWAGTVNAFKGKVEVAFDGWKSAFGNGNEHKEFLKKMEKVDMSAWADSGADFGESVANGIMGLGDKISNTLNYGKGLIDDMSPKEGDYGVGGLGDSLGDMAGNTGETAKNTGRMADALDATAEDLKYLRQLNEQRAINRITQLHIEMPVNTSISNNSGSNPQGIIDSVVTKITNVLNDAVRVGAEGVHA